LEDLFRKGGGVSTIPITGRRFRYVNYFANMVPMWPPSYLPKAPAGPYHTRWDATDYTAAAKDGRDVFGEWKITSCGPDKTANPGGFFVLDLIYDPTNGTVSGGDIIRSQKMGQK